MPKHSVRLACVKHTASVHPEPGSNSPFIFEFLWLLFSSWRLTPNTSYLFFLTSICAILAFKLFSFPGSGRCFRPSLSLVLFHRFITITGFFCAQMVQTELLKSYITTCNNFIIVHKATIAEISGLFKTETVNLICREKTCW